MPSAKSVPHRCVVSASRSSASRASSPPPARQAASTSSGSPHVETHGSNVFGEIEEYYLEFEPAADTASS